MTRLRPLMDMNIKQLLKLQRRESLRRGWRCPDEAELAAYVAGPVSSSNREFIEAHIADCDFCLGQVAFLTQSAEWNNADEVPANLISKARDLVARKPDQISRWNWRWAATATAFACLALLAVVIALQLRQGSVTRPDDSFVARETSPAPLPSATITTPSPERPQAAAPLPKTKPAQSPTGPLGPLDPIVRSDGPDPLTP